MPRQSAQETRKLVAFVATVLVGVVAAWFANRTVRDRESADSPVGFEQLFAALTRLNHDPAHLSMTMGPSTVDERRLRHANARIRGAVDVLVLGQSDADHMSQTFFRDDVRFYNGFISNSFFTYQCEVFDDLVAAHGVPRLVLYDVRSSFLLNTGAEPFNDTPPADTAWWAGPLFRTGKAPHGPIYADLDSLLSLQQSELTLKWVGRQFETKHPPMEIDVDTGAPYLTVDKNLASTGHRWLADGSRVYPREVNGVLVPRGQAHIEEATGDRKLNVARLKPLEASLRGLVDQGATVIVYSPPLQPRVFEDGTQAPLLREAGARLREITTRVGVDYCDLSMDAEATGCVAADHYDELHISRHCNKMVIRKLATGCAPRAEKVLRGVIAPSILTDPL